MKIVKPNAGPLTNFEVLDFFRSRGAAKDPTRVIVSVAPSEFKVFDYLDQSAACNQTKESVAEFLEKAKQFKLVKAEVLNIINIRPASEVEIYSIVDDYETRLGNKSMGELIELVAEVLPLPAQIQSDEASDEARKEISDGKQANESL